MDDVQEEKAAQSKPKEVKLKVRPTVFIAIGGSGKEILLRLRRRILNADWNGKRLQDLSEFPIANFLYFDLDTTDAKESDKSAKTDPFADTVVFQTGEVDQRRLNHSLYTRELDRFRLIKEWWPKANVERIETPKGAGQFRPLSRLHFFSRADELKEIIRQKGKAVEASLTNEQALEALGLRQTQKDLRIVVVASVAGGTGSGSFLDMGYLLGTVFPEAETNLLLLLPSGFYMAGKEMVCANGYAALMELEYCMRHNKYVEKWADHQLEVVVEAPYKEVYLLDITNMAGEATRYTEDLYNMIADVLFEDFGSAEFAARKRSVAPNQQKHKTEYFRPELGETLGLK